MLFVHIKLCPRCQTYKQTGPLCSPEDLSQHFKQCCSQRLPQALHAVDCHSPLEWLVDPLCRGGKSPRNACRRWECGRRETNICKQFHSLPRRYETAGAMPVPSSQTFANKACLTPCHLPDQNQKVRALAHHTSSHLLNPCSSVTLPPLLYSKTLLI